MTTTPSYEKKWLIKTDQKITGPFSYEQIEEQLRKKQISVIDEIRDMEKRWSFIREVPELKDLVENIRSEMDSSSELTQTVQTRAHQETHSIAKKDFTEIQEILPTPKNESTEVTRKQRPLDQGKVSSVLEQAKVTWSSENAIDVDFKENNVPPKAVQQQQKSQISRFGAAADYNVQKEVKNDISRIIVVFSIVAAIGLGSYFGYVYNKQQQAQKADTEVVNQIRRNAINKHNQKVIESFTKATPILQHRVLGELINYFPLLQNNGVSANDEFISRFKLENNLSNVKKSLLDMFLFHRSMSMKDFEAARRYLLSAKDSDPSSEIVLENEAIYLLQMEKYKDAYEAFSHLTKREDKKGRWFYGQLLSQYKLGEFFNIQDQQELLGKFLNTRTDFKRELLMFQIYLSKKEHNKNYFMRSIRDYIDSPTQFSAHFRVDPLIWIRGYDYKILDNIYLQIQQKQKGLDLERLLPIFVATYSLESEKYTEVDNFLKSSTVSMADPDKININFQYLMIQGRKMEALAVIKSSGVDNLNLYSHLLLFKFLFENRNFRDLNPDYYNRSLEILKLENQDFLSTYAKFILGSKPSTVEEKNKLREFLEIELVLNGEFIPFLEAKGDLN